MRKFILPLLAASMFAGCSPESDVVYGRRDLPQQPKPEVPEVEPVPPDEIKWITLDGGQSQLDFNPQVDILFVTDNSESMKSAQENLSRNINRFVEGFNRNRMIDFHIGVISVWDSSERFITTKKDGYGIGELRRIKNGQGQTLQGRFVKRFKGADEILAATLKLGIAPYAEGGPEVEEMFSPLAAALKKTGRGEANEEFFRPEAQLVVVVVSDADDSTTSISPEEMAQTLFDFKGGKKDKVSAFGVLVKKSDDDAHKDYGLKVHPKYHPECFDITEVKRGGRTRTETKNNGKCKEGFGPDRLEQFIVAANPDRGTPAQIRANHIMGLVQRDFGKDLAKIGSDITMRTLAKEIFLDQRPRLDEKGQLMIRVRYGTPDQLAQGKGQLIPQAPRTGWLYDPENNSIKLSGEIEYQYQEGARFAVDMVPVLIK